MSQQTHIKTNTYKIFLVIFFLLVFGFGFGKGEKAKADDADDIGDCSYKCSWYTPLDSFGYKKEGIKSSECFDICKNPTKNECNEDLIAKGDGYFTQQYCLFDKAGDFSPTKTVPTSGKSTSCSGTDWVSHPVDCSLLMLLNFFIWLMQLASALFGWIMVPDNITTILSSKAIYNAWTLVRDTLNVFFIMFLLFSAFATVFQIDKYNYKKTLLMIVLMALLVNFSFPISRFIIDISNMMMFYFASALDIPIEDGKIMVGFASAAKLPGILYQNLGNAGTALLAAVIFVFIFTVTILTISVLFLIRTIALAILIVFSSLAFVGTAIPPLSSYASDWWKKLFSYAFFGPVMLFMMYIASYLMNEIGSTGTATMEKIATANSTIPELIANMSFFAIPIVLLWLGLGVAQSMSIAGASMVVGKAQGFMKGAGKWTAGAPWKVAKMSGIPGGAQAGWKNFRKTGKLFGGKVPLYGGSDAQEAREAKFGGVFKDGRKGWTEAKVELERTRANKLRKDWKDQGAIDKDSVYKKLESTNPTEQKAAALEIAENHSFESYEQFKKASTAIGNDPVFKKIFDDKAKEKHINFVAKAKIEEEEKKTGKPLNYNEKQDIYNEHFDKLDNKKWASQINLMPKDEKGKPLEESEFVKEYIKENIASHYPTHQDIFKNLKGVNKKQWADAGLAPTEKRNSDETSQSARSNEDIQREMKQKNQERMDNENEFKQSHEDIQKERARKAQEEINKQNI